MESFKYLKLELTADKHKEDALLFIALNCSVIIYSLMMIDVFTAEVFVWADFFLSGVSLLGAGSILFFLTKQLVAHGKQRYDLVMEILTGRVMNESL